MKKSAALLAAGALLLVACDQRTPTGPAPAAPLFQRGQEQQSELHISGSWELEGQGLMHIPYSVTHTVPGELCTSDVIVTMDDGQSAADFGAWIASDRTTHAVWTVNFRLDPIATSGVAKAVMRCSVSGTSEDVQTGHATRGG